MKYWRVEVIYPIWCESPVVYFAAKDQKEAKDIADAITESEAISEAAWRMFDTEKEEEDFIEETYYNLFEVSYEEAKEYI